MAIDKELKECRASIKYFETLHRMKQRSGGSVPLEEAYTLDLLRKEEKRLCSCFGK